MHYLETWGNGWHYIPGTFIIFMLLMMAICFFIFYRRRGQFTGSRWFRQNWRRNWFRDCCSTSTFESPDDILKKRYARGEINKDEFEKIKKDITDLR